MKKVVDILALILLCSIIYFIGTIIFTIIYNISTVLYYIITIGLVIASGYIIAEPFLKKKSK